MKGTVFQRDDIAFQAIMADVQVHLPAIQAAKAQKVAVPAVRPIDKPPSLATYLTAQQAAHVTQNSSQRRFCPETMRFFQTFHAKSPGAYNFVRENLHGFMEMPSEPTLAKHKKPLRPDEGVDHAYLAECRKHFDKFKMEWEKEEGESAIRGERLPKKFPDTWGVLFDETRLKHGLQWHKDLGVVGMSDMDATRDIETIFNPDFTVLDIEREALYVMQAMFRHPIFHNLVFAGPHFFSSGPMTTARLCPIWEEVIQALYLHGFPVHSTVLDGSSVNVLFIQIQCGFPSGRMAPIVNDENPATMFKADFWCSVPGYPNERCYFNICNPHQCKSMVAVVHASKSKGARELHRDNIYISWDVLTALWGREISRGECRSVPNLKHEHIHRGL